MAEVDKVVPPAPVEAPKAEPVAEPKAGETLLGGDPQKVSEAAPVVAKEEVKEAEKTAGETKVVPETYTLKLPEGSALDQAQVDAVALFSKENGLTNDQAQKVLEQKSVAVADFAKKQNDNYEAVKGQWLEACKTDTDFGGEKLKESVLLANSVIGKYGSQALKDNLNATGLGNHPELLRMMVRIGREMGSDKLVQSGEGGGGNTRPGPWDYMNEGKHNPPQVKG